MWTLEESQSELKDSIRELYAVLRKYNKPGHVTGCPHCTPEEYGRLLESRPLRDLDWPQLEHFAFKAMTTMGTLDDFKRFLPRLLELITLKHFPLTVDPQTVLGKIAYAERDPMRKPNEGRAFNGREREAIERFLAAWWRRELAHDPDDDYGRCNVLECIGCATGDIAPYLAIWSFADGLSAALHLAKLVNGSSDEFYSGRKAGFCFWSREERDCDQQLMAWLRTERCREILERPLFDETAGVHTDKLYAALGVLEFLAAQQPR